MIRSKKHRGLGDVVEAATKATGIKSVVDKVSEITGRDCGCGKRKEALNKLVPFKKEADADELQPDQD
tara:strand:+ start:261 stop:464 length:204 start_codon:yes stop_codon:yes gene_type:complete